MTPLQAAGLAHRARVQRDMARDLGLFVRTHAERLISEAFREVREGERRTIGEALDVAHDVLCDTIRERAPELSGSDVLEMARLMDDLLLEQAKGGQRFICHECLRAERRMPYTLCSECLA